MTLRSAHFLRIAAIVLELVTLTGCRSYHVETTIENRTGAAIRLVEVDYPNASFGANSIASGADYHYRIQLIGSGKLKVQYTASGGHPVQITGPELAQGEQGRLQIVLLPNGKADFQLQLTSAH